MSHSIVAFLPINEVDYDNPSIEICVINDQFYVDSIDVVGETVNSLKCESFAHALMRAAMLLIYTPNVKYTVEGA